MFKVIQALPSSKAKILYKENVQSFYNNLSKLYSLHKYHPKKMQNCDKSNV